MHKRLAKTFLRACGCVWAQRKPFLVYMFRVCVGRTIVMFVLPAGDVSSFPKRMIKEQELRTAARANRIESIKAEWRRKGWEPQVKHRFVHGVLTQFEEWGISEEDIGRINVSCNDPEYCLRFSPSVKTRGAKRQMRDHMQQWYDAQKTKTQSKQVVRAQALTKHVMETAAKKKPKSQQAFGYLVDVY